MPRKKREHYEWVPKLNLYRKRIKDTDGKYVPIYAKTEAEMDVKLEAAKAAIAAGLAAKENMTVAQYAAEWLELSKPSMGYKYYESMEQAVRLHIVPVIGGIQLRDVMPNDCIRVKNKIKDRSRSLNSKVLSAMRQIFDSAVKNKKIESNPCEELQVGGMPTAEKTALTSAQKKTLLDAVKGTRAETFVMLGLYTGLRREEILGLRWENVDLKSKVPSITVCQAVKWPKGQKVSVEPYLKTEAANRTIPIPKPLKDHLLALPDKTGHVIGGEPLTFQQFRNLWSKVERCKVGQHTYRTQDKSGKWKRVTTDCKLGEKSRGGDFCYTIDFDVTPHILRHTYITDLILSGANPRRVQYLAGHSNIKTTMNIYTHLVENAPKNLAKEVNKAFKG